MGAMRYATENVEATLQPEGYLEVVVAEHRSLSWEECRAIAAWLREQGWTEVRVLVTRAHQYGPPRDYMVHDLSEDLGVMVTRIAYFAPMPTGQTLSHVVGESTLRHVAHQIFAERERAVAWLLAESAPPRV